MTFNPPGTQHRRRWTSNGPSAATRRIPGAPASDEARDAHNSGRRIRLRIPAAATASCVKGRPTISPWPGPITEAINARTRRGNQRCVLFGCKIPCMRGHVPSASCPPRSLQLRVWLRHQTVKATDCHITSRVAAGRMERICSGAPVERSSFAMIDSFFKSWLAHKRTRHTCKPVFARRIFGSRSLGAIDQAASPVRFPGLLVPDLRTR